MPGLAATRVHWIAIIFVAIALRLAGGVWWQARLGPDKQFYFGDSDSYWVLGRTIARGEDYQYLSADQKVLRTPGYPLLLAGLYCLWGENPPVMAARALSALLGGAAVGALGWWTTRLFDSRTGIVAGWLATLSPGAISMGVFLLSEAPFCPLMLLQLALWGLAWRADTPTRLTALAIASGAAGGLACLMRPSWLLFAPLVAVLGILFTRQRARQLAIGALVVASVALVMLPWWIRNAQVTGRFVPTALVVGASLYDGLNPHADGSSNMQFVQDFAAAERSAIQGDEADTFEYRLDRRMRHAALDWAGQHPWRVAALAGVKFWRMWNVWPNEPGLRSWPIRLAILFTYLPLLLLSLLGAWRYAAAGWPYMLCWLPAVYLTLLHVVFVGSIRYREPAMLALLPLAAGVLMGTAPRGNVVVDVPVETRTA